jgi:hypothetical protein
MTSRAEHFKELALVIEQTDVTLRHKIRVTDILCDHGADNADENGNDENGGNHFVVHVCSPF